MRRTPVDASTVALCIATSVDGVPVNMPTHAHGQGYTDINFVIPELVNSVEYRNGSVESQPTTLVNVEAGYRFTERLKLSAALFNVFDSKDNDIAYFYESQLPGESAPVEDSHLHPVEPRTVRVTLTGTF